MDQMLRKMYDTVLYLTWIFRNNIQKQSDLFIKKYCSSKWNDRGLCIVSIREICKTIIKKKEVLHMDDNVIYITPENIEV